MKLVVPSREFDEAVAAVCHGSASDGQMRALNEFLRIHPAARDEYILRLELHSRLASDPDLFARENESRVASPEGIPGLRDERRPRKVTWAIALAACMALLATGWWVVQVSLVDLQNKSSKAEVLRHEQWRAASSRLDEDPSLLVHFDFEQADLSDWRLPNASKRKDAAFDATIVGCQWTEGRWPDKRALEFRGVSDRVRLGVPGEFDALTLAVWLRVQRLDRQINSLLMSDGFEAGTVRWSIRHDGVLGLTAIGSEPGHYQICASPPVLTLDQFGLWVHLAVVIDGGAKHVAHYLNGVPVSEHALNISPPFRIGVAELGNWNAQGFPKSDPFMIRNFSGAMDEFSLFSRALNAGEIHALYAAGAPQPDPLTPTRN